jgi:hypothetical protein
MDANSVQAVLVLVDGFVKGLQSGLVLGYLGLEVRDLARDPAVSRGERGLDGG